MWCPAARQPIGRYGGDHHPGHTTHRHRHPGRCQCHTLGRRVDHGNRHSTNRQRHTRILYGDEPLCESTGDASRTLPPLPYRQVPYDPATAIGGVPGYFFVPESLPIDPRHADLLRTLWRYYEVRFAGEATLQTARFTEVMDGQALTTARTTIDSLRGTGRGRRYLSLDGTLHPQAAEQQPATLDEVKPLLMECTTDRAELFSRFNAFIVPTDPASGYLAERIPDHDEAVEEFFTVRRIAGDWKVSVASFGPFRE